MFRVSIELGRYAKNLEAPARLLRVAFAPLYIPVSFDETLLRVA